MRSIGKAPSSAVRTPKPPGRPTIKPLRHAVAHKLKKKAREIKSGSDQFKMADNNGDGQIDRQEKRQAASIWAAKKRPRADLNGDGKIDRQEFKQAVEKRQELAAEKHPDADLNGDGRIGRRERKMAMAQQQVQTPQQLLASVQQQMLGSLRL